jgi:DNA-directed RNA polymerase subunit M/transcription elongation factor TFIIS
MKLKNYFIYYIRMEEYRDTGKEALKLFLNKEQNINTFEKYIYDLSDEDYYKLNIYQTICDINSGNKLASILNKIKEEKIDFKHDSFVDYIFEEEEQNNFLIKPFEIEEGVLECKCGSKRVYSYSKQSRSADEPMSTYAECMSCRKKWTYSG